MGILDNFHGIASAVVIVALLFIDEAGMPIPIAPNEALLVIAGLLIASGALAPLIFLPVAAASMTAGMVTGYGWARGVGTTGLRSLARRFGAGEQYDRAHRRLRRAGPGGIAVARLVPGVRAYATLVSGAAEIDIRRFLLGAVPALLVWLAIFTALGFFVGLPVLLLLDRVRKLLVSGLLLVVLAAGTWVTARHLPAADDKDLMPLRNVGRRLALALVLDFGIVVCLVTGVEFVVRVVLRAHLPGGGAGALVLAAAVTIGYIAVTRRGARATLGERLLFVSYRRFPSLRRQWRHRRPRRRRQADAS